MIVEEEEEKEEEAGKIPLWGRIGFAHRTNSGFLVVFFYFYFFI